MKEIKGHIKNIIITCVLLIIGVFYLGYITRPLDTDGAYDQIESFHSIPNDSVEVMLYGSSHTYRGFSTQELYEKYGIGAYNYGWNWQKINTIKLFVKDSLVTQSPKVALIDTYTINTILENKSLSPEIYYSKYIKNKKAVIEYQMECAGNNILRFAAYQLPLYWFHENWTDMTPNSFKPLKSSNYNLKNMGFAPSDRCFPIELTDQNDSPKYELDEKAIKIIDEIVKSFKEKNTEVIFFTIPYLGPNYYTDALDKYAKENDCVYIDLFKHLDEMGFNQETDFSDDDHLNTSGSIKVADYIGKFLKDNYELTDMREIEGNLWEKNLHR